MALIGEIRTGVALLAALTVLAAALLAGPGAPSAEAGRGACPNAKVTPNKLSLREARTATLCLLNKERAQRGLRRFDASRKLRKAAQRHTETMQAKNCFAHQCPGEGSLDSRLRSVNYIVGGLLRWFYAENIAWGERSLGTPRSMMQAWMRSSGHRRNILNPTLDEVGVGFVHGSPYRRRVNAGTYTTDFGFRAG